MRVIGVDLAWAEHNRTGLCAVDAGRVVASTIAGDDDEVVEWIEKYTSENVVVAFDAPLIVTNRHGCRGPERVIASAWGRAHASCHVANRSRPWFSNGGRAHHLARRLRLPTNPAAIVATPTRVAIEVYPHTALVSLLRLPIVLKYKAGRCRANGVSQPRTVDGRRGEFRRLLNFLLDLDHGRPTLRVTTCSSWPRLVAAVERAKTGAELDVVEDELDAYVCAYVGLHYYARRGRSDCVVIGDERTGYIVTPVDAERRDQVRAAADKYGVRIA